MRNRAIGDPPTSCGNSARCPSWNTAGPGKLVRDIGRIHAALFAQWLEIPPFRKGKARSNLTLGVAAAAESRVTVIYLVASFVSGLGITSIRLQVTNQQSLPSANQLHLS